MSASHVPMGSACPRGAGVGGKRGLQPVRVPGHLLKVQPYGEPFAAGGGGRVTVFLAISCFGFPGRLDVGMDGALDAVGQEGLEVVTRAYARFESSWAGSITEPCIALRGCMLNRGVIAWTSAAEPWLLHFEALALS